MLFNSHLFIFIFLPVCLIIYWLLGGRHTLRQLWLLAASFAFYGYWNVRYVPLLLGVMAVNFLLGQRRGRGWLLAGLGFNLAVLFLFRFYNFFADSVNAALDDRLLPLLSWAVPLGISYYILRMISYLVDVHQGTSRPARNALSFALFTSFFPLMTAGPIARYSEIGGQIEQSQTVTWGQVDRGLFLFIIGLAKKLIIADQLAAATDLAYLEYQNLQFWGSWLAALGYTLVIYFDFSGYTDMALGIGSLLGYDLPPNFESPYTARNLAEFWQRWHISLSRWLRDYIFLPSSRYLLRRTSNRVFIFTVGYLLTMGLSGLWHGSAWTFVVWGLYHGVLLAGFQLWRHYRLPAWQPVLARGATFAAVLLGWVLFRSASLEMAGALYARMLGLNGFENPLSLPNFDTFFFILLIGSLVVINLRLELAAEMPRSPTLLRTAALSVLFVICLTLLNQPAPFIYLRF